MLDPTMYASGVFTGIIVCLMLPFLLFLCLLVADCKPWLVMGHAIRGLGERMESTGSEIDDDQPRPKGPKVAKALPTRSVQR